jgi:hypothetical protein
MAYSEAGSEQEGGQVLPIEGKQDECQTRWNGQEDNAPSASESSVVQYPSDIIEYNAGD